MTKLISIASLKGGVGKSTTAMMIADTLAYHHGAQVLVIDLDAQANCSQMILSYSGLKRADNARHTLTYWVDCLARGVNADLYECVSVGVSGLSEVRNGSRARFGAPLPGQISIVPATPQLRFTEMAFDYRAFDPNDRAAPRNKMKLALEAAVHNLGSYYNYIVFDCPPGFTTLAQAALMASHAIITPSLDDPVSVWSLKAFRDYGLKEELGVWKKEAHRVVYTRVHERGAAEDRFRLRQDVILSGFEVLGTSIKDTVEAIRWSQRAAPDNFTGFNAKYGPVSGSVEQLGKDVVSFTDTL